MIAIRYDWVTVVRALLDQVELVAPLRTHFVFPKSPLRVERDAQRIAVAITPDLGFDPALIVERVAAWDTTFVGQPDHLAKVLVHVLRGIELLAVAAGDE